MKQTTSPEETVAIGRAIGGDLNPGDIVYLYGDLGAGKTTLVKGIAQGIIGSHLDEVTSPTFTYLHIYEGRTPLYHFDLYRLSGPEQFAAMGFEEFFGGQGIACIEWPDRIGSDLSQTCTIRLRHCGDSTREIVYDRSL